jgi:hypothetical protein
MGIHDVVAEIELDVLHLADDVKVLEKLCFSDIGDGSVLLGGATAMAWTPVSYVCR